MLTNYLFSDSEFENCKYAPIEPSEQSLILSPSRARSPLRISFPFESEVRVEDSIFSQSKFDAPGGDLLQKRSSLLFSPQRDSRFGFSFWDRCDHKYSEEACHILSPNIHRRESFSEDSDTQREKFTKSIDTELNFESNKISCLFQPEMRKPKNTSNACSPEKGEHVKHQTPQHHQNRYNGSPGSAESVSGQNSVAPTEPNRCESETVDETYSELQLELLFGFFSALFLNRSTFEDYFNQLSQHNLALVRLFLKKRNPKLEDPVQLDSFQDFWKLFESNKSKKRKEEKLKMVYKHALRYFEKRFAYKSTSFIQAHYTPRFRKFLGNKKSIFYLHFFWDTITGSDIHEDLVMDILFERVTASKPQIQPEHNWRQSTKATAMKKVSASMRYLIKNDRIARDKFLDFIDHRNGDGLVRLMEFVISQKLEAKKKSYLKFLESKGFDFRSFKEQFERSLVAHGSKSPWTMAEVEDAIDVCKEELTGCSNAQLKKEFLAIQRKHYTSTVQPGRR